jgi:hypothetical protein
MMDGTTVVLTSMHHEYKLFCHASHTSDSELQVLCKLTAAVFRLIRSKRLYRIATERDRERVSGTLWKPATNRALQTCSMISLHSFIRCTSCPVDH